MRKFPLGDLPVGTAFRFVRKQAVHHIESYVNLARKIDCGLTWEQTRTPVEPLTVEETAAELQRARRQVSRHVEAQLARATTLTLACVNVTSAKAAYRLAPTEDSFLTLLAAFDAYTKLEYAAALALRADDQAERAELVADYAHIVAQRGDLQ